MAQSSDECYIYIDNSNLFIEGQKYFARARGFRMTVTHDIRFRIDIGRLVEALAGNREMTYAKLYGSEPPANDSLWQKIRSKGVEVKLFQRNSKDMEKEVDTALASDVSDQAAVLGQNKSAPTSVTFIIIGGDRDFKPPCEKVLKYKFNLEVAAWRNCLSRKVKKYVENEVGSSGLRILDDLVNQNPSVYYLADEWTANKPLPRDRTMVFEFKNDVKEADAECLNSEVTDLIKLPCCYLLKNPKHVMIIIIHKENVGKYSTSRVLEDIRKHEKFCSKIKRVDDFVKFMQDQSDPESLEKSIILNQKFYADVGHKEDSDDNEGFEVVEPKQSRKSHQKYSEQCPFEFACKFGNRCPYAHSPEEKEHFMTPSNVGKLYKAKYCLHAQNRSCKFSGKSKNCCFAHSLSEARCYNCKPGGLVGDHWMDECKKKKS